MHRRWVWDTNFPGTWWSAGRASIPVLAAISGRQFPYKLWTLPRAVVDYATSAPPEN